MYLLLDAANSVSIVKEIKGKSRRKPEIPKKEVRHDMQYQEEACDCKKSHELPTCISGQELCLILAPTRGRVDIA